MNLLIIALCAQFHMPTVEHHGNHALLRLQNRMIVVRKSAVLPTAPDHVFWLQWEYPLPLPRDVVFDIQAAMTPDGPWATIASVSQPPYGINTKGDQRYFRVETRNL